MSVFNKVITEHLQEKLKAEQAAAAEISSKSAAEAEFSSAFKAAVEKFAKPVFEEFVRDAISHGFPAAAAHESDGTNPIYSVKIIPEKGASFGANASNECVFNVRGVLSEGKVEHSSYFEQRVGKKPGLKKEMLGIQSINTRKLEEGLDEFLRAALKARGA